jgi:hypothetical protein
MQLKSVPWAMMTGEGNAETPIGPTYPTSRYLGPCSSTFLEPTSVSTFITELQRANNTLYISQRTSLPQSMPQSVRTPQKSRDSPNAITKQVVRKQLSAYNRPTNPANVLTSAPVKTPGISSDHLTNRFRVEQPAHQPLVSTSADALTGEA